MLLIRQFKKFLAGRTLLRFDLFHKLKCSKTGFAAYSYWSAIVYLNFAVYNIFLRERKLY